jgi:hypothetical protein
VRGQIIWKLSKGDKFQNLEETEKKRTEVWWVGVGLCIEHSCRRAHVGALESLQRSMKNYPLDTYGIQVNPLSIQYNFLVDHAPLSLLLQHDTYYFKQKHWHACNSNNNSNWIVLIDKTTNSKSIET